MNEQEGIVRFVLPKGSVMLPAWVLVFLCSMFVLSAVGLILTWTTNKELVREIRVLQIHAQDIETQMKLHHLATDQDFPQWEEGSPRHAKER